MPSVRARATRMEEGVSRSQRHGRSRDTLQVQCLLWILILSLWSCLALAQPNYDFDTAAADAAGQLAQHFPHLQGEIVDVQGEQLYLSLGARDLVLAGMRLDVFREGEALTSPTTGEELGRLEERLGTVTVTDVGEAYAVAVLENTPGGVRVQAGDQVRITAGRLSLAVMPVIDETAGTVPMSALDDAVQRGFDASSRFRVIPRARLTVWLLERGSSPGDALSPEIMQEAASALGVAYIAQPVLRTAGNSTVVELRLFAPTQPQKPVSTGLAILSQATPIRRQPVPPPVSQPSSAVSTPENRPDSPPAVVMPTPAVSSDGETKLQSMLNADPLALEASYVPLAQFPAELRGFDAADVDGDGQSEVVILSDTKVSLYHVHESQLVPVASYSDRRAGLFLSAQLVRLGDDERLGVVINRFNPNTRSMDSLLLALQGNRLVRQQKSLLRILLAVDLDGDGVNESVWAQRFDRKDFFRRGQVRLYQLRDGRLKRQRKKLELPAGFRATGAALARLGVSGSRQLVFVDEGQRLQVYDGKARRWTAPAAVGGSYVFATLGVSQGPGNPEQKQFGFQAIPAVADFDGDGIDEVLVPQNQAQLGVLSNLNLYSGGRVVMMRQTPQGFTLSPVSPAFDGVVSGVAVLKGRVPGILVAVSMRDGVLRQKKRTILYLNRL